MKEASKSKEQQAAGQRSHQGSEQVQGGEPPLPALTPGQPEVRNSTLDAEGKAHRSRWRSPSWREGCRRAS